MVIFFIETKLSSHCYYNLLGLGVSDDAVTFLTTNLDKPKCLSTIHFSFLQCYELLGYKALGRIGHCQ